MKRVHTFSVLFYLKKDKVKKKGLVPIHARITINGKQTQFNTESEVFETNWKSGRAIGKSIEIQRFNSMSDDVKANTCPNEQPISKAISRYLLHRTIQNKFKFSFASTFLSSYTRNRRLG